MSKRRIVIATLVAAIVVAVLSGEVFARRGVHHAQFGRRHLRHDVVRIDPPRTTVDLPAMRYYGGQKSPMWRG
jgi:hypothetical protein